MDEAIAHCTRAWASGRGPATATASPTSSWLRRRHPDPGDAGRADLLRTHLPDLKVAVINVVDLMRLEPDTEHPHGLLRRAFDALFTADKPIVFAYHGYPSLIHRLTYRRNGHRNLHVRGYKEEGTTTTPFDMVMMNDLDRFHLVMDVIDRVPSLGSRAATLRQQMSDARLAARAYTREHGEDDPAIAN
jgi:xylulose-5-phosphate/fructose-6-phosphate phosphoketolase